GVPIQVWSTKSFAAQWQTPFDPARPPVSASLKAVPGERGRLQLSGTITTLARLDQSLRLDHEDEVMVVGRIARKEGPAEDVASDPVSASRLWLGALPGTAGTRPPLNGTLSQETFVRIIIPVGK